MTLQPLTWGPTSEAGQPHSTADMSGRVHNQPYVLDLIIPALNEERRIGSTIAEICQVLSERAIPTRLIVVDNGSVDRTADVVHSHAASIQIDFISCRPRGKGAAVKAGVAHATAPYVGYCDADRSTPPAVIEHGLDLLTAGWDFVIGSRRCPGANYAIRQSVLRRVGSKAFNRLSRDLVGTIDDTQCGFKLFRRSLGQALFQDVVLNGFAFDVELIARARRVGARMIEMPIEWSDSEGSSFRALTDGLATFRELLHVGKILRQR